MVAIVCLLVTACQTVFEQHVRFSYDPHYRLRGGARLLASLAAFVGFFGSVTAFVLFLRGWVAPDLKQVYFKRIRNTFFVTLIVTALTFVKIYISHDNGKDALQDVSLAVGVLAAVFMIMSGIAALVLFFAGWAGQSRKATIWSMLRIGRGGKTAEQQNGPPKLKRPPEETSAAGRIGRFCLWMARFVAILTGPAAVLYTIYAYSEFSKFGHEDAMVIFGPLAFFTVVAAGAVIAAVLGVLGAILMGIAKRRHRP